MQELYNCTAQVDWRKLKYTKCIQQWQAQLTTMLASLTHNLLIEKKSFINVKLLNRLKKLQKLMLTAKATHIFVSFQMNTGGTQTYLYMFSKLQNYTMLFS